MRWLAISWVGVALAATALLGAGAVHPGRIPEVGHLAGHLILCGGLAAMVAAARPGSALARARDGWLASVAFGLAIELVQARYGPPLAESLYDLAVDAVAAGLGLVAWAWPSPERRSAVGTALSAAFHPVLVAPPALVALVDLRWAALATACAAPAVAVWAAGCARGWWSDADVSVRAERWPLFLLGCATAATFAGLSIAGTPTVARLAVAGLCGALGLAILTAAGLKVSGHVAIPATLGLLVAAGSPHAAIPVLGAAAVLTWARPAASRHRAIEVVAGWVLAVGAAVGGLSAG